MNVWLRQVWESSARGVWRLVDERGESVGVGLFISEVFAKAFAIGHGWKVVGRFNEEDSK